MEDKLEELLDRYPPSLSEYGPTSLGLRPCWSTEPPDVEVVVSTVEMIVKAFKITYEEDLRPDTNFYGLNKKGHSQKIPFAYS